MSEEWGEFPPIEIADPMPNQEPQEYVADFLQQWSEDEDGYYGEILRMAAEMLRHGTR